MNININIHAHTHTHTHTHSYTYTYINTHTHTHTHTHTFLVLALGPKMSRAAPGVELCQRWSVVILGVPVEEEKVVGFGFLPKNYVVSAEKNDAVFIITLTFIKTTNSNRFIWFKTGPVFYFS